ncbi:hypothetical protein CJO81_03100 [Ralstonia solanacearum]|uniref:hypothetical protein n=1 Tax=Ralstonia pseudosolanacearum TaxID=1310165 RepID=UPI000E58B2F2|nr:hypothetical protein [Ralstonia pseudosolanacearum]AXV99832.1 hypothetical protein CJO81_03100 [Ralstonia solanacearum]AXW27322.1 hypothetical protein CJO87_03095 [Ralstonia solanacearum]NJZ69013.1 hypothetical protein [Ralstonia solanacearum]NKF80218.1 hypothetical protein [Ralstonia solanacearum]UYR06911.1 hypothetical protein NQS38_00710 [Ralstonia pseudosolanacearum]
MNIKPWSRMPVEWITDGRIQRFNWMADRSAGTASLMLFFVLCHFVSERLVRSKGAANITSSVPATVANSYEAHLQGMPNLGFVSNVLGAPGMIEPAFPDLVVPEMVAHLTYDDFSGLTGLSRKSISAGLRLLEARQMIRRCGSARTGDYHLEGLEPWKRWAKLPGQALLSPAKTSFVPLTRFDLRSKHELNALKLHLYYASVRDRSQAYSECTFETINKKTGVSERDIPKANSILLNAGLLARYARHSKDDGKEVSYSANRYYMEGYGSLFKRSDTLTADAGDA